MVAGGGTSEGDLQTLGLTRFPVSVYTLKVQATAQAEECRRQITIPKQPINHSTAVAQNLARDRNELIQECPKLHFQNLIALRFVLPTVIIADGDLVENVRFSDIVMTDILSPLFIRVGRRFRGRNQMPSVMRNLSIDNVTVHCRSVIPSIIAGLDDSPVSDIQLSNLDIVTPITITSERLKEFPEDAPENTGGYPENRLTSGFRLPTSAFYICHAERISLHNVIVTGPPDEVRPAVYADDVRGLRLQAVRVNDSLLQANTAAVRQRSSSAVEVSQ